MVALTKAGSGTTTSSTSLGSTKFKEPINKHPLWGSTMGALTKADPSVPPAAALARAAPSNTKFKEPLNKHPLEGSTIVTLTRAGPGTPSTGTYPRRKSLKNL